MNAHTSHATVTAQGLMLPTLLEIRILAELSYTRYLAVACICIYTYIYDTYVYKSKKCSDRIAL